MYNLSEKYFRRESEMTFYCHELFKNSFTLSFYEQSLERFKIVTGNINLSKILFFNVIAFDSKGALDVNEHRICLHTKKQG